VGWKGLINDPHMNDSFDIEHGLQLARKLLVEINEMGIPVATETLDPINPQYLSDLIAWSAIGARTTESQTHREMASGLSTPTGFKNGTDGGLQAAINALLSVSKPHSFLGINQHGQVAVIRTRGNRHGHLVLRGGSSGPNYDSVNIALAEAQLAKHGLAANIMVDCSHANSNKDAALQPLVMRDIEAQIAEGNRSIIGVMLESNINEGNQCIPADLTQLRYGVSVTDACIGWEATEELLRDMRAKLKYELPRRLSGATAIQAVRLG
jgi:3-deoxy-7-phosphoheptulonate synthase